MEIVKTCKTFDKPTLKNNGKEYRWISFIPLIGGMSMGCSLATQNKPVSILSYSGFSGNERHLREYWDDVPFYYIDKLEEENKKIPKKHFKNIDFVNAVPPCSGLSQLNSSTNKDSNFSRGSHAKQNEWMYISSEYVLEYIKPKVLWGENAPALFTKTGKGVVEQLNEIAKKYGYSFSLVKTSTIFHGLPQKRDRTFYFFWKSENAPILKAKQREQFNYVDYLESIPKNTVHQDYYMSGSKKVSELSIMYKYLLDNLNISHEEYQKKYHNITALGVLANEKLFDKFVKFVGEKYPDSKENKFVNHVIKKREQQLGWWDATPHAWYKKINAVVGRNLYFSMHPKEDRYLSLRELMHLMGLPLDFNLVPDSKGRLPINHIAQNVPTLTTRDWCLDVLAFINDELILSNDRFLKQNNFHMKEETHKVKSIF